MIFLVILNNIAILTAANTPHHSGPCRHPMSFTQDVIIWYIMFSSVFGGVILNVVKDLKTLGKDPSLRSG
jgi:hypothetical protein